MLRTLAKVGTRRVVMTRPSVLRMAAGARGFSADTRPEIIYTMCDEAPALATYSLLPIIEGMTRPAGINVRLADISLAARVIAQFPEHLNDSQRLPDTLAELGDLAKTPQANIIKLPNISASVPQMVATIKELQGKGYKLPDYPEDPKDDAERDIKLRYGKVMGSAVNPVLREGNSDRRAALAVKQYARKFPHSMGAWFPTSRSHVSYMTDGDFFSNEKSVVIDEDCEVRIEHVAADGKVTVLRESVPLLKGEVLDGTFMSKAKLETFVAEQITDAKKQGVLFSLHLKATMMKVSDPIMFGIVVKKYFANVWEKHGALLDSLGVDANNGFGDLLAKIETLPKDQKEAVENDIQWAYDHGPEIAMVDSSKGITNLHVPSDVIVDASMPAMIRTSGQMWDAADRTQDAKCVIPDQSYAGIYETVINFCRMHGAFDPTTMGSVANVGLMAQKAQEYGSHDKTFQMKADGVVRMVRDGKSVMEHKVENGDIWRACQTKDGPIRDWVKLAVTRARATDTPAVFWLDEMRAHDANLIQKVETYLKDHDTEGLDIRILAPKVAMRFSLIRMKAGQDCISVTGNVLRDYLTDLFPILELGTSAKMLSIVPLMNGGGMFETGAGGSAPKHVQQFEKEGHLRWDSLGEFLALAVSLEHEAAKGHARAKVLYDALDVANTKFLLNNKSPMRKVNQLDNRGSHFYFAMYWANALAKQDADAELKTIFTEVSNEMKDNREKIVAELKACQGEPVFTGGYFKPDEALLSSAMRPSPTLNAIIDKLRARGQ